MAANCTTHSRNPFFFCSPSSSLFDPLSLAYYRTPTSVFQWESELIIEPQTDSGEGLYYVFYCIEYTDLVYRKD